MRSESTLETKTEEAIPVSDKVSYARIQKISTSQKIKYISIGFAIGVGAVTAALAIHYAFEKYLSYRNLPNILSPI